MAGSAADRFEGVSATELRRRLIEAGDRRLGALSIAEAQRARREQAILVTELQRRGEPLEDSRGASAGDRYEEILDEFTTASDAVRDISKDRLICDDPVVGSAGEISVTVATKPPGAATWTPPPGDQEVTLARHPSWTPDLVTQQITSGAYPIAVTDTEAAASLGVDVETWAQCRDALEAGMARALGETEPERPARIATDPSHYVESVALEHQGPAAALMLGVAGNDPQARRDRMAKATAVAEAWAAAPTMKSQPFGLYSVLRAGGDLERALADPEVATQTADLLGLSGSFGWVHDEDGQREVHTPSRAETPEGRHQIGKELARISRQVGVAAPPEPPSPALAGVGDARVQERLATRRPALVPPAVGSGRPEERATWSPGPSAPGPGVGL